MKIVLLGYMASGKSLIGKQLSNVLDYKFIDLDNYIESEEQDSVKSVFATKGELYFRKIERKYLKQILEEEGKYIISLGGGTPCYYDTMQDLVKNKFVKTVYLKVSIPELVKRLEKEKSKRPLIAHLKEKNDLVEFIGKHLFERNNFYNQAEIVLDANKKVNEIIEKLLLKLF